MVRSHFAVHCNRSFVRHGDGDAAASAATALSDQARGVAEVISLWVRDSANTRLVLDATAVLGLAMYGVVIAQIVMPWLFSPCSSLHAWLCWLPFCHPRWMPPTLSVAVLAGTAGTLVGSVSGYAGGAVEAVGMRASDEWMSVAVLAGVQLLGQLMLRF